MILENQTNLYRAVAQVLEWTHGKTRLQFEPTECYIAVVPDSGENEYAFQVVTNTHRLTRVRHPLAMVVEQLVLSITGICIVGNLPTLPSRNGETKVPVKVEDYLQCVVKQDGSGFSTIGVQFLLGLHNGGDHGLSRHFVFRHNMMNHIR